MRRKRTLVGGSRFAASNIGGKVREFLERPAKRTAQHMDHHQIANGKDVAVKPLLVTKCHRKIGKPPLVGNYRLSAGPDAFGELVLQSDGRFRYVLGAGGLDEHAEGRWVASSALVQLYTTPRPKAATFAAGRQSVTTEGPLKLLITWPNGSGIAGVDFKVGFDAGEPDIGYTQDYGWTMSLEEHRIPRWVEFVEPLNGIVSPRFAIDLRAGNVLTYVLTPNDLGTADFDGTMVERVDDHLVMHQRLGDLTFVRTEP